MDGLFCYMMVFFPIFLIITVILVLVFIELPMLLYRKYNLELYQRIKPKIWIAYLIVIILFITISVLLIYDLNQPSQFIY